MEIAVVDRKSLECGGVAQLYGPKEALRIGRCGPPSLSILCPFCRLLMHGKQRDNAGSHGICIYSRPHPPKAKNPMFTPDMVATSVKSVPILHTRSRTNSLVKSPCNIAQPVHVEHPMGSFVPQFPSCSDSLKALSRCGPPSPSQSSQPFPTQDSVNTSKAWWSNIKRAHSRTRTPSLHSIPSFSRTQSPELTTEPELESPLVGTPSSTTSLLHPRSRCSTLSLDPQSLPSLDPRLARLEKRSRLKKPITCIVCQKVGDDFPRCGKCGLAWCSRSCRLNSLGQDPSTGRPLKKHTC